MTHAQYIAELTSRIADHQADQDAVEAKIAKLEAAGKPVSLKLIKARVRAATGVFNVYTQRQEALDEAYESAQV